MSAPRTARDHALRVAALEALADAVTAEYEKARAEAETVFAGKYADEGNDRQAVLLPSGEKIGQITIRAPRENVSMHGDGLAGWAEEHIGDEAFEEFIPDTVLASREVLALIKAAKPELVGRRLRRGTSEKLVKELVKSGGWLQDAESGEKEKVADVAPGACTGAFSFTDQQSAARRARIMAELTSGNRELRELAGFGPLALPAGGSDG